MRALSLVLVLSASVALGQGVAPGGLAADADISGSLSIGPGGVSTDGGVTALSVSASSRGDFGPGGVHTDGGVYLRGGSLTFPDGTTQTTAPSAGESFAESLEHVVTCSHYTISPQTRPACSGQDGSTSGGNVTTPVSNATATKRFLRYTTAASNGSTAGWGEKYYSCTRPALVRMSFWTGSNISAAQYAVGIGNQNLFALTFSASFASTAFIAGYVYKGSLSANWLLCTGNGTNASCTDTGVAAAANTAYSMTLDIGRTTAGSVSGSINGTPVAAKTTHYPLPGPESGGIYYTCGATTGVMTTEAVAKVFDFHWTRVAYELEE